MGRPLTVRPLLLHLQEQREISQNHYWFSAGEEDTPTSGTCGENLTWELDLETGTLTISGTGDMKDYEQVYNGDADYSFSSSSPWSNCDDIKSVIIESGVTSIGKCAFVGCKNLSGILIPNSIMILRPCIQELLRVYISISVPGSVSVINPDTFAYCSNLTSISIPNSITGIGWGAFRGCKSLENIIIPQSVVLYIGESAFGDCSSLTSVIIPQGITRIGDKTFSGCYNLTNIMLPKSIDEIDWYAFENCDSLTDIYYAGSEYEWSNIEIDSFRNDALLNATIHYNSTGPDSGDTGTTIPDGRTTAVKYLTSWDETSKTACFLMTATSVIPQQRMQSYPLMELPSGKPLCAGGVRSG